MPNAYDFYGIDPEVIGYYITAYGIAVKHGYNGTEEEWLKTLKGEQGTPTEMRYNSDLDQLEWKLKTDSEWTGVLPLSVIRGAAFDEAVASIQASTNDARQSKEAAAQSATEARGEATKAILAKQGAESARDQAESLKSQTEQIKSEAEQIKSDVQLAKTETEQIKEQTDVLRNQTAGYKNDAEVAMHGAQSAKGEAENKAAQAAFASNNAAESAQAAEQSKKISQSWAVGGTGERPGEDINNAKYWSDRAQDAAGGGVTSFNGRTGAVVPQASDYSEFFPQPIQLANNLTTTSPGKGLDAAQGAILKEMIDNIPKTPINNTLTNDSETEALSAKQGKILNETKLGKSEKAADSNLLDGHDSTYFATASAVQNVQNTANRAANAAAAAHQAANAAQGRADGAYQRADQAFTSASNGKLLIANTLTGMGTPTSTTASWQTISDNIKKHKYKAGQTVSGDQISVIMPGLEQEVNVNPANMMASSYVDKRSYENDKVYTLYHNNKTIVVRATYFNEGNYLENAATFDNITGQAMDVSNVFVNDNKKILGHFIIEEIGAILFMVHTPYYKKFKFFIIKTDGTAILSPLDIQINSYYPSFDSRIYNSLDDTIGVKFDSAKYEFFSLSSFQKVKTINTNDYYSHYCKYTNSFYGGNNYNICRYDPNGNITWSFNKPQNEFLIGASKSYIFTNNRIISKNNGVTVSQLKYSTGKMESFIGSYPYERMYNLEYGYSYNKKNVLLFSDSGMNIVDPLAGYNHNSDYLIFPSVKNGKLVCFDLKHEDGDRRIKKIQLASVDTKITLH